MANNSGKKETAEKKDTNAVAGMQRAGTDEYNSGFDNKRNDYRSSVPEAEEPHITEASTERNTHRAKHATNSDEAAEDMDSMHER